MEALAHPAPDSAAERVPLWYIARAGLLPELSRQTYDSFYKAIREAILNAMDARASRVDVDFSRVRESEELVVSDDGLGMSKAEFLEQFMSLGGSTKFGDQTRFGRIGIGSLALMQYGTAAVVETKQRGARTMVRAHIDHPWTLTGRERRAPLSDLPAGFAEESVYDDSPDHHFTRLRIVGVNSEVLQIEHDPNALYALLESLQRVLPLPWITGPLLENLERESPVLGRLLRDHISHWSIPVHVHSSWGSDMALRRRTYGDAAGGTESWNGRLHPILKTVSVEDSAGARDITVAGYLLSQRRAFSAWSGVTARVQNVAVEERSFFDVTSDPGFRKYISGELFIMGQVDRERLINIDRASFNREADDYRAIQRFMSHQLLQFKSSRVQRPQRQKVEVRKVIERHRASIASISEVVRIADTMVTDARGLPSSRNGRITEDARLTLADTLERMAVHVVHRFETFSGGTGFELAIRPEDGAIEARLTRALTSPRAHVAGVSYAIGFCDGRVDEPPVLIRNRPREIVFNCAHPAHAASRAHARWHISLALELSYLLTPQGDSLDLFDRMLRFVVAL